MTRVARVSWRTVAAALPAVALVGSGLVLVATDGTPSTDVVAGSSPLVTVPRTAIQHPEAPALPALPELPAPLVDAADAGATSTRRCSPRSARSSPTLVATAATASTRTAPSDPASTASRSTAPTTPRSSATRTVGCWTATPASTAPWAPCSSSRARGARWASTPTVTAARTPEPQGRRNRRRRLPLLRPGQPRHRQRRPHRRAPLQPERSVCRPGPRDRSLIPQWVCRRPRRCAVRGARHRPAVPAHRPGVGQHARLGHGPVRHGFRHGFRHGHVWFGLGWLRSGRWRDAGSFHHGRRWWPRRRRGRSGRRHRGWRERPDTQLELHALDEHLDQRPEAVAEQHDELPASLSRCCPRTAGAPPVTTRSSSSASRCSASAGSASMAFAVAPAQGAQAAGIDRAVLHCPTCSRGRLSAPGSRRRPGRRRSRGPRW